MSEHLFLIARLEALLKPDRGMDWAIHLRDGLQGVGAYGAHPHYTASLDTAVTLVPDGWSWRVAAPEPRNWGQAVLGRSHPTNAIVTQEGRTPIIALCIAALKAREVQR